MPLVNTVAPTCVVDQHGRVGELAKTALSNNSLEAFARVEKAVVEDHSRLCATSLAPMEQLLGLEKSSSQKLAWPFWPTSGFSKKRRSSIYNIALDRGRNQPDDFLFGCLCFQACTHALAATQHN